MWCEAWGLYVRFHCLSAQNDTPIPMNRFLFSTYGSILKERKERKSLTMDMKHSAPLIHVHSSRPTGGKAHAVEEIVRLKFFVFGDN